MKIKNIKSLLTRSATTVVAASDKKESIVEFIWEMVSCWLLALGTSLLQNVQLPYPLDNFTIVWHTALAVTLLALFSRRWFLMLIVTIQIILLGLLAMLLFQLPLVESVVSAVDFCRWFFQGMPYDALWSTGSGMVVLHTILDIGISILMFFVVRVSRGALPPMILCFSLLILIMTFGDPTNNAAAVALYLAGCLPMIARDRYNGRQLFSGEEKYRAMGSRWGVSTTAGIICVALAGGLLLTIPIDTDSLRVRWCADVTADLQSLTGWYSATQRENDTCTLDTLGLQAYPDRLGGNIEMPEPETLAITDATEPMLMRVTAFDTFTGENWEHNFSTAYRLGGPFQRKQAQLIYNQAATDDTWGNTVMRISRTNTVNVTVQKETFLLPTLPQMRSYTENTETNNPVQCNRNGEIVSFFGFDAGYQYTLETLEYPLDTMADEEVAVLNIVSGIGKDAFYDNDRNLSAYLAIPDTISNTAAKLAAALINEEASPIENAQAIMNYFSTENGFWYTQSPSAVRDGENVVDKLLTERKGYCVYYASTMAMMTRAVGIPTRLAAGYLTVADAATDRYVVDACRPYAWVECYFRNLGWVAFDPTPSKSTTIAPVIQPELNQQKIPEKEPSDQPQYDPQAPARIAGTILLVLILLALVIWVLHAVFIDRLYSPAWLRWLLRNDVAMAEVYYADILRQVGALTAPYRTHQTALEFLQNPVLTQQIGDTLHATLMTAVEPMMAAHYGESAATAEDVETLATVHAALEAVIRRTLRPERYILHRHILRPLLTPAACRILYNERKNRYEQPSVTV